MNNPHAENFLIYSVCDAQYLRLRQNSQIEQKRGIIVMKETYALVTGASRGIGRAIACALAKEGFHLICTCLKSEEELLKLKTELEHSYPITCRTYIGDVGDYEFVSKIFEDIRSLDILVNNAGISHIGLLSDMTPEEWDRVIRTNLTAVYNTCHFASKIMVHNKRGKILNISSIWGTSGASMEAAYSASKGGVNALTRALAKELAPSGIQVNALACGVIDTDMNRCFTDKERRALIEEIPADRFGTPEDVAQALVSLLHAGDYLTGQVIHVDGAFL